MWGLTEGYCLMVGGTKESVAVVEPALLSLAPEGGYAHVGPVGAGHFVKMVHNGIEYGLMQAYAEGFEIMGAAHEFDLDLHEIAAIWRYGSVVRSWLLELTERALRPDAGFEEIKGVGHRLGRGPLDGRRGHRPGRPGPGHLGRPLRALRLAPAGLLRQQAAGRPAQPVRRPRGHPRVRPGRAGDLHPEELSASMTDVSPVGQQVAKTPPPLAMVIFGASGDLTARKILPALADLANRGRLNERFSVIGVARTEWTDEEFQAVAQKADADRRRDLGAVSSKRFRYVPGEYAADRDLRPVEEGARRGRPEPGHRGQPPLLPGHHPRRVRAGGRGAGQGGLQPAR